MEDSLLETSACINLQERRNGWKVHKGATSRGGDILTDL